MILLIEDNEDDARMAAASLRRSGLTNTVKHFPTCDAAWMWLNTYEERPLLILLDLWFEGGKTKDGMEFLRALRGHISFRSTPVIIMTIDELSKPEAYGLGAIGYLVKPIEPVTLLASIQSIGLRWAIVA